MFIGIGKGKGCKEGWNKNFGYLMKFAFSGLHFASDVGQGPVLWFWSLESEWAGEKRAKKGLGKRIFDLFNV